MAEASVVMYRGRPIDLAPYLEGFPFSGFEALPEANLLLYFYDLPNRRSLKLQPLDRAFDPALGREIGGEDWNRRSFWYPKYHSASNGLVLTSDEANDEVFNVYRLSLATGELSKLTSVPYVHTFALSPDERQLAYIARFADGPTRWAELHALNLESGEDGLIVRDMPQVRLTWGNLRWPDESHLLAPVNLDDDRNRQNAVWINLASPALAPLLDPAPPRSSLRILDDLLDPNTALVASNETGYLQVYRLDLRDGALAQLTDEPYDYRSVDSIVSGNRILVATVGERPQDSPMRVFDPATNQTLWEHVENGSVYLSGAGPDRLYGYSTSLVEKWTMWRLSVDGGAQRAPRWERLASMPPEVVQATSHAGVELITYPTFDRDPHTDRTRQITAFLLTPKDLPPPEQRRALVLAFYGGSNTYRQDFQILAQAGFIVLSPAVRGSFGYGREFYALIDKDLGGNEMIDVIYGARYLQQRFGLSARQIGVFGASHGGFATVRALTLPSSINGRAESFDWGFGWAHAGFYDITTFWRDCNIPDWVTQKAGDPVTEREKLLDRSPLTHAQRLHAPLYLTHGDRDNRVPVNESRALVGRLQELGKDFRYDEFPGHGHPLKGIAAQRRLWQGLLAYLENAG